MQPSRQTKNLAVNISLFFASLIILLVLLESVGLFYYKFIRKTRLVNSPVEFSGYRLYSYQTNSVIPVPDEGATDLKVDKYGFVMNGNVERDYQSEHNSFRILVFGGSTMEGRGVSKQENMTAATLEKMLSAKYPFKKFEVINLGVSGYQSFQEFLYLKEIMEWLKPQAIIFIDGFNDMHYGYLRAAGLFEDFSERNDFSPRLVELEDSLNQKSPFLFKKDYFERKSYFLRGVFSLIAQFVPKIISRDSQSCGINSDKAVLYAEKAATNYSDNLLLAKYFSEMNGVKFYVFLQPIVAFKTRTTKEEKSYQERAVSLVQRGYKICESDKSVYSNYEKVFFELADQQAKKKLKNSFVNLSDLFKEIKEQLFVDSVHYNDQGNEIIAEELIKFIEVR